MPKWQRAVNSLLTFARSLYDQFQLVDGRGDFEPSLHEPDHKLTRAQFLNLLVYLGLLEPELRGQGNEPGLEALSRLGDEVGRMALEEATDLFKKRSMHAAARASSASRFRQAAINGDEAKEAIKKGLMTRDEFEACLAVIVKLLHDKKSANQDDPFRPLTPPPKRSAARKMRQSAKPHAVGAQGGAEGVDHQDSAASGVTCEREGSLLSPRATTAAASVAGGGHGRNRGGPVNFRSVIKTPVGRFVRISSRRADTERSSLARRISQQLLVLPSASTLSPGAEQGLDEGAPEQHRAHTARPSLGSHGGFHAQDRKARASAPASARDTLPKLSAQHFGNLLHVAPESCSKDLQEMAAGKCLLLEPKPAGFGRAELT